MFRTKPLLILMILFILLLSFNSALLSQDAQPFINQGLNFAQNKMWDKAIEQFQKAIAVQPKNPVAHNNLGYVLSEKGFFKEAFQEYEIALKIKPDYREAQQNMLAGVSQWSQDLIDHGQYSTAEEILKGALARFPNAGEFYYFLGVAYQAQDKFQEALDQWKKAARLKPDSSTAYYVKAIEKLLTKDVKGSIQALNDAIRIMPNNAYAYNMLGILLTQSGKPDEAITNFEAAIKYKPNYVEPYLNIAYLFEKDGKYEDAIKYYKTATIKNPYSVKGLMAMGKIYFNSGRYFDAESCYNRALRIQPLSTGLFSSLAFTFARQNKYQEAIKAFETSISLNPNNIDAHYALGLIFKSIKGDDYKKRAIEEFQKCVAIDPNNKYSQMAVQKLGELGASISNGQGSHVNTQQELMPIQCESPDGDLSLSISPKWQEVPLTGEGADKFLWIMSDKEKGLTLTVYKPQPVPVNNLDMIKGYSIKEAEKKGAKKQSENPVKIGGQDGYMVLFADNSGNPRFLFLTVKNKKAYIFIADMTNAGSLPEVEKIMNSIVIR